MKPLPVLALAAGAAACAIAVMPFASGPATTVRIMAKDARKYASTGGSGLGRRIDSRPVDAARHETCSPCDEAHARGDDLVFTRDAP